MPTRLTLDELTALLPRLADMAAADTLLERLTGQATADQVPVEVQLLLSDQTLAGATNDPATLLGFGPVPAPWARALVRDTEAELWVRRLYSHHGQLVAMDSGRRCFPEGLRRFIVARDETCRTPWCDAPIRHIDHAVPHDAGGPTDELNAQGLCQACNHAKQAPGWRARPGPDGAGEFVTVSTPTGHQYVSRPPSLDSHSPTESVMERHLRALLDAHVA